MILFRFFIFFGVTGFLLNSVAFAMPEYALREHKQCIYCHYDARGGGPTNAAGRYFAQHLSLEGYVEKQKKRRPKKSPETTLSPAVQSSP